MSVLIVTSLGDIVVDLYTDRCPLTSKNFLKLCKIKYYNGCLFHTVQKDFTTQTGDPSGTGSGGDSIYKFLYGDQARFFGDEIHLDLKHSKMGTVAMASAGEDLNASQFYITLRDDLDYLDGKHTVFGEVAEGLETLSRMNEAYVDEKGRPYKNIRIKHTYILDDPFDDPPQLAELIPDASPEGKPKDEVDDDVRLEDDWVPMDEQLGQSELEELLHAKEAHSRAVVLESIGDIPDSEIKPPDNVLFVCKLNPVTEDEDLHTIFSRFGTVTSAEIIRDYKTGDSLCYAFIEFEDKEACEQAYFKMDNALIDDRRIHVDFSQSVSKLWSQYRRRDNSMGKGRGCFKCGSHDHIAKDCPGDTMQKEKPPKYILKDDKTQHGDGTSRFEMVFDEDAAASPRQKKRHREHEAGDHQQNAIDYKERDRRKRESYDFHRQGDRSREHEDDERVRVHRTSPSAGRERDHTRREERDYRSNKNEAGHRERKDGRERGRGDRRYERDNRKRSADDVGRSRDERDHGRRTDNDVGHLDRRDERDDRKRSTDDVGRRRDERDRRTADDVDCRDRGDERDNKMGSVKNDTQRDQRDESSHQKENANHNKRDSRDELRDKKMQTDKDGHKGRGEELDRGKRSTRVDDYRGSRARGTRH